MNKKIGGFFAIELPNISGDILIEWTGGRNASFFLNARSAFASLIESESPRAVWLPAFLCGELADVVPNQLRQYYSVGDRLSPVISSLKKVQSGDMILGINYFGCSPNEDFINFVKESPNILFVEDCSHCLKLASKGWGDWQLYSPRKLLGVADGGVLVARERWRNVPQPSLVSENPEQYWMASISRFEDPLFRMNPVWHRKNQFKEDSMSVSSMGMTCLSKRILSMINVGEIAKARLSNFRMLEIGLSDLLFKLDFPNNFIPFAFPIRVKSNIRDSLLKRLHANGIFASIHWRDLPSPSNIFQIEHQLSQELISLPCDHRYDGSDMSRIIEVVKACFYDSSI